MFIEYIEYMHYVWSYTFIPSIVEGRNIYYIRILFIRLLVSYIHYHFSYSFVHAVYSDT